VTPMHDRNHEEWSPAFSLASHGIWLAGGAIGRCLGLFFVAHYVMPYVIDDAELGGYLCGASVGAVAGWVQGFATGIVTETSRACRWFGFVAAFVAGAWATALLWIVMGVGACC
jgi:hypothetical protein